MLQLRRLLPVLLSALLIFLGFAALAFDNVRRSVGRISASEARLRDVAQAASDWMWETDAELRLTYLSDHFTPMTGMDWHSALGRPLIEIPRMSREDERFAVGRREAFRDLVCRLDRPDKATRTLRVAATPMTGRQAEFQGYRGTATDIKAETALCRGCGD